MLEKYNEIIPDGANRIMKMAEVQSTHRQTIEKEAITKQLSQSARGQHYGLIIGTGGLIVALVLGLWGDPRVAGIIGGADILGLVYVFVIGKNEQEK